MSGPKFIAVKLDWGTRLVLDGSPAIIEDRRAKGGGVMVFIGPVMIWASNDMRAAKGIARRYLGNPDQYAIRAARDGALREAAERIKKIAADNPAIALGAATAAAICEAMIDGDKP